MPSIRPCLPGNGATLASIKQYVDTETKMRVTACNIILLVKIQIKYERNSDNISCSDVFM